MNGLGNQLLAGALTEVRDLGNEYSEQIASAQDQQEAQELQQEAQVEMVAVVEDTGLTVEEYNQIAQQLSQDQELLERVQAMLQ
jgi:GTP1/Obg family GTP-binding protein